MIRILMTALFAVALASAVAQAQPMCMQSFTNVKSDRLIQIGPGVGPASPLLGRSCGDVERERAAVFVNRLASISAETFSDWRSWQAAEADLSAKIREARAAIDSAKSEHDQKQAQELYIGLVGATVTVAGCVLTPLTAGVSGAVCGAGLGVGGTSLYRARPTSELPAAFALLEKMLADQKQALAQHEAQRSMIMGEMQRAYLERFETMCAVVRDQCR